MSFAEQLKSQLNIVDVVGQYVRLKRSGAAHRFVGLCPFHSEKTPSFSVHSGNQFYYCFGCGATGDVFKFVQEMETLTFPEVLRALAERNGIPVPERQRPDDPKEQEKAAIFEMQEIAAQLFQDNLRAAGGSDARAYLQSRGVSKASADEFRLGLSDASGQQLFSRLKKFPPELLERSGLISRRDGGGMFDRFRARLMFPIHNELGKVIAFGGRALRAGDEPKYLNSAESDVYKKSTVLYNLHRAKMDARKHDRIILVEGYMDAIAVYASGLHEVAAICGTSLSNDQVRAIKNHVAPGRASNGQVILNLDPDEAGSRSTEKYVGAFLAEGLRLKVLKLPGGLDPDEYIQKHGAEIYAAQIGSAPFYFHWLAERAREKFDIRTVEGKVDAFKSVLPALQQVSDKLERSAITNQLSDYFKLDRSVIADQLRQSPSRQEDGRKLAKATLGLPPNEVLLLASLLVSADAREAIVHFLTGSGVLQLLELKPVFDSVIAMSQEGTPFSISALSALLEPRLQRIVTEVSFAESAMEEEDAAQQAIHCLRALEEKASAASFVDVKRRIRELEEKGNLDEAMRLIAQLDRGRTAASRL